MTPRNGIPMHVAGNAAIGADRRSPRVALVDVGWTKRLCARLFATRYDERIERGDAIAAGTPLAAHYLRLTSRREREDLAAGLTLLLQDAGRMPRGNDRAVRVPIRADVVRRSADIVEDVLARLLGPLPVRARGMARLRILLSDGRSPVYLSGNGTFAAAMRGVLAAM